MYQPMLYVHWKQIRVVLIPFIAAAFGLPLLAVQGMGATATNYSADLPSYAVVSNAQLFLPLFPILAFAIGMTLALSAWNWDHQHKHVWALSLPLARWEYVMLKMGAGAALALLPVAALWVGAQLASAAIDIPGGLQAYPNQLAMRFLLAILASYSVLFAMAAGTIKTTVWVVSGVAAFVILGSISNDFLAMHFEYFQRVHVVEQAFSWLWSPHGPLEVFTGNWALIDV